MRRRFWLLYPMWILFCAGLFWSLRNAPDPSRPHGRILSDEASARAVAVLQRRDPARFASYQAVHVAFAAKNEGSTKPRWVVLCDSMPHSALRNAVVVEIDPGDGSLLRIRKPVR